MAYTLLQLVQLVLSSIDGDEVNDISNTTESLQVVNCAQVVYNDLILTADLPEEYRLFSLTPSGSSLIPIVMYRPANYETIEWIKYKRTVDEDSGDNLLWTPMKPVGIDEFLKRQDGLNPTDTNVDTMLLTLPGTTLEVNYYNDRSPNVFTTFDDHTIIFDSIDKSVDTTLQSAKTLAYGQWTDTFVATNTFTPSFDNQVHQLWLHETKALASAELRQLTNNKAEKGARKGWIKLQDMKEAIKLPYYGRYPNYSRK